MHLLYIGNELRLEQTVREAAAHVYADVRTTVISSGKGAIIKLLEHERTHDHVVIDCGLKDVKCLAMIDLILKNQIVSRERISVIGLDFSEEDIVALNKRNIRCVKYTFDMNDLANHFREVFSV